MEDLAVHGESGVGHDRDRRVQKRMVGAVDVHVEAGCVECVTGMHSAHPLTELSKLASYRVAGPQAKAGIGGQRRSHRLIVHMIDMLVRDQHSVRLIEHTRPGPDARVDDEPGAVLLQPDTGMAELRQQHEVSVPSQRAARPRSSSSTTRLAYRVSVGSGPYMLARTAPFNRNVAASISVFSRSSPVATPRRSTDMTTSRCGWTTVSRYFAISRG